MFMRTIYLFVGIFFCQILTANAIDIRTLNQSEMVTAVIQSQQAHRYNIKLSKNQFAEFRLVQLGADLQITTFDPLGNKIDIFDFTGNYGEEIATITSDIAGAYALEVEMFNTSDNSTEYSLELKRVSKKATTRHQKINQYMARWDSATSPGLAIAITKDSDLVYSDGFGQANLEHGVAITPKTAFSVASISKQFAAFSILLLAAEGKLSIDDEVRKHLPSFPDFGHKITLKHLLHHTSGLREQGVLRHMAGWLQEDVSTKGQAIKLIAAQQDLNFEPGEKFEYSNSGYITLAQVVSQVSGQTFPAFAKQRIFEPLGMSNSAFPDYYQQVFLNKADSYRLSNDGFAKEILHSNVVGSTGLITTAEDLAKWAINFEQLKVGEQNIVEQMKMHSIFNDGGSNNNAFGQVKDHYKGTATFGHGGTMAGFRSFLLRIPSEKLSVVVLANFPHVNPLNIAYELADFYLPEPAVEPENIKATSTQDWANFTGDFEILGGISYKITLQQQQLYLQVMGGAKQPLTYLQSNEFSFGNQGRKLRLSADKLFMVEGVYGGDHIVGTRVILPSSNTNKVDLTEFIGQFYSPELKTSFDLIIENENLIAKNLRSEVLLTPFEGDSFSGNTGYLLKAHFIRDHQSKVSGFEASGTLINRVKFIKVALPK